MKISKSAKAIEWASAAVFLFMLAPLAARAQVIPDMKAPAHISAFGDFDYGYSDWTPDAAIYGFTVGGFLQTGHLWGIEARGSLLRWGAESAQASALFGPRAAIHYGRFTPYGVFLAGVGHARYQSGPHTSYNRASSGGEWKVLGGVDFRLNRRVSIRLGEVSYAKIYVLQHGLTPTDYSGGIVFRLR